MSDRVEGLGLDLVTSRSSREGGWWETNDESQAQIFSRSLLTLGMLHKITYDGGFARPNDDDGVLA